MADPYLSIESVLMRRSGEEKDWSFLSADILELVLALLSFPEVYRLRSVCKRWNDLIKERPWGPFYSPRVARETKGSRSVRWFAYDLSETPLRMNTMPQLEFPECASEGCYWDLIAADGGLLCFSAPGRWRTILVCNPMTKAWRKLPDASCVCITYYPTVRHMVVDKCRSSYKIIVAGDDAVASYDSAANKWSAADTLSREIGFRNGAYCNGEMYFLGRSDGVYMVMVLELTTLSWRADTFPMPASCVQYPIIVVWSGDVYLVGGSYDDTAAVPTLKSILLFRLDPGGRWTRLSEYTNRTILKDMGAINRCGVWGGQIFVVTSPCNIWAGIYDMWVAVYNCATGIWEEPVKEDFFDMKDVYGTEFPFEPNLVVAP